MKNIRWYILIIVIIFVLSGCKSYKNQGVKFEKKDKAPKVLGDISSGIQDILKEVEEIESILDGTDFEVKKVELKKAEEEEKAKLEKIIEIKDENKGSDNNRKTMGQKIGSENEKKAEDSKNKEQKKYKDKDEKLLDKWEEINKKLEEIHSKWNSYEIEGMKKGVTSDISNRFKDSLNALTSSIEGKNIIGIYDYSSQTMLNLSPIFGLYKDEIWGEINKLKYLTYQSYLNTLKGDDLKTIELLKGSEEDISKIRLKLEKNDSKIKMLDKVNLSIEDMNKSLKENSIKLIRIKKDIIIKNLEELGK
ncbi:hypothetical protein [Tissierella sp.]|uniref:hypothetical protein n=1 Tax=Tissierella sp. TaxID=41274 RepID=UPI0028AC0742|nr:hypothetical protein [Tissierella sp.]